MGGLTISPGMVYPVCLFVDAAVGAAYKSKTKGCGSYHTMLPVNKFDRNMGSYLSSKGWDSTTNTNKFNVTIYGASDGTTATLGYVVYPTIVSPVDFKIWGAIGIGSNRMVK